MMPAWSWQSLSAGRPFLAVGIDLDDLRFYRAIHALPQLPDSPILFEVALPRFLELCAAVSIRASLFAIGLDMDWVTARRALRDAVEAGHEVGNHSLEHRYDLARSLTTEADVREARERLEDATGREVVGFRSPGYNLSSRLLKAVAATGHRYDSSLLPSPTYFMARAAIIASMRLRGRRSASMVGKACDFMRSREPFVWGGTGLIELPITACGPFRLPLIGTFLRPWALAESLIQAAIRLPFVNVEFHGIDFLDIEKDRLDPALAVEPVLRVPLADRLKAFSDALRRLADGRNNAPLSVFTAPATPARNGS